MQFSARKYIVDERPMMLGVFNKITYNSTQVNVTYPNLITGASLGYLACDTVRQ
jgi:hypothetical protein